LLDAFNTTLAGPGAVFITVVLGQPVWLAATVGVVDGPLDPVPPLVPVLEPQAASTKARIVTSTPARKNERRTCRMLLM
jgi:hypothetical protein